ncbi:MAG: HAMP domain-containing histidine kinase [Lachnospiraceae bacterium]|nr:HAMP domain-containing histidine kinase [Lachnospiraceae bacterium]
MGWLLFTIAALAAVIYIVRFYSLKSAVKKAAEELVSIEQNPEDNRILLLSFPDKELENLLKTLNRYILLTRKERIFYQNREKALRAQIENISHDLRTPLTAIIGYLELLDTNKLSAEDAAAVERVSKKAKSLQGLIGNFYDLSRLEMNDYHLNMEKLEIIHFAKEISLLFYQEFEKKKISVQFDAPEEPLYLLADTGALERIFNNMLQNALRYAESSLYIGISAKKDNISIVFENDTSALKPEDAARLFERFYVQEKSRTSQSTGLGLTISKLLTEAMGGSVEAEVAKGKLRVVYCFEKV